MQLQQNFHALVYNVYTVEGTLILSAESRAPDLIRELHNIRTQVAALPDLEGPARAQVEAKLDAAVAEGKQPHPSGATIKAHLDTAAGVLQGATGIAEGTGKLARVLLDIGKWAVTLLT